MIPNCTFANISCRQRQNLSLIQNLVPICLHAIHISIAKFDILPELLRFRPFQKIAGQPPNKTGPKIASCPTPLPTLFHAFVCKFSFFFVS